MKVRVCSELNVGDFPACCRAQHRAQASSTQLTNVVHLSLNPYRITGRLIRLSTRSQCRVSSNFSYFQSSHMARKPPKLWLYQDEELQKPAWYDRCHSHTFLRRQASKDTYERANTYVAASEHFSRVSGTPSWTWLITVALPCSASLAG